MSDKYNVIGVISLLAFISIGGCYDMYLEAQKEKQQMEIKKDSLNYDKNRR